MKKRVGKILDIIAVILIVIAVFRIYIIGFYADEYWVFIVLIVGLISFFIAGRLLGFSKENDNKN